MQMTFPQKSGSRRWLLLLLLAFAAGSCHRKIYNTSNYYSYTSGPLVKKLPDNQKFISWNVLFVPGTSNADRTAQYFFLQNYLREYIVQQNALNHTNFDVTTDYVFCPCDTNLYNYSAQALEGTGQAPAQPSPPKKGIGPSGGLVLVSPNHSFDKDSVLRGRGKGSEPAPVYTVDNGKILAVMDTGLDTLYFASVWKSLLWSDPTRPKTLRNFVYYENGRPLDYFFDDDTLKHGTAVTAIALDALDKAIAPLQRNPRLMVLKVLDAAGNGSTFSVSCALSYATQQHATLINASLGYYSTMEIDSVLRFYVKGCDTANPTPIPIMAAAGNTRGVHTGPLCGPTPDSNQLTASRLFYPACFNQEFKNVYSVTGLQNSRQACIYQNYSSTYVNIGVVNDSTRNCCSFQPFPESIQYEGSSFATPVVSGRMLGRYMKTAGSVLPDAFLKISGTQSGTVVTKDGRFLVY